MQEQFHDAHPNLKIQNLYEYISRDKSMAKRKIINEATTIFTCEDTRSIAIYNTA